MNSFQPEKLQYEVLVHIFANLDLKSLCRSAQVSKWWYEASRDASLYHYLALKNYWNKIDNKTFRYFAGRCKNIRKLDVSWCGNENRITEVEFLEFLRGCCKQMTHFSAGYCEFLQNVVIEGLSTFHDLTDLRLRNCQCDSWQYSSLAHLHKLVALDLYSSSVNDDALIAILKSNPNLRHLIIGE